MTLSLLTFFVLSADFISFDNPRSSNSSLDIVAAETPSFLSKSLMNLNSVEVFGVISTAFIDTNIQKRKSTVANKRLEQKQSHEIRKLTNLLKLSVNI